MKVGELKEILDGIDNNYEIVAEWEGQQIKFNEKDIELTNSVVKIWVDNINYASAELYD